MKKNHVKGYALIALALMSITPIVSFTYVTKSKKTTIDYKNSEVSYYGTQNFGKKDLLREAKLIDIGVKSVDRVEFFQDELQFFGTMDVAFQRCHMLGYVNTQKEHIFEGSYVILWKKVDGNWLIQYDMFNADK